MDKNELDYQLALISAKNFEKGVDALKHLISAIAWVAGIFFLFRGLGTVLTGQSPEGITAIARVIEVLKVGSILGYVWGGLATAAWFGERTGKKRAIKKKAKFQAMAEGPSRVGSELTETGGTPT